MLTMQQKTKRKGLIMKDCTKHTLLVGAGILAGVVGAKVLTSPCAKSAYVRAIAGGMKVRSSYETMVEQAKVEYDDLVAKASYLNAEGAHTDSCGCGCESTHHKQDDAASKDTDK